LKTTAELEAGACDVRRSGLLVELRPLRLRPLYQHCGRAAGALYVRLLRLLVLGDCFLREEELAGFLTGRNRC
jgi:hypothetical protein